MSPSFTGRPFIEGGHAPEETPQYAPSPSFTGRPFIEGQTPHYAVDHRRRVSPSFTGRPFIEGSGGDEVVMMLLESPSFTGRPFIEGSNRFGAPQLTVNVAVLYGTAFH